MVRWKKNVNVWWTGRPVILALLLFVVDNECTNDAGDPAAEGKQEDDQYWAAALVNHGQGREENAYEDTPETHFYVRLAITKIGNSCVVVQFFIVYDDGLVGSICRLQFLIVYDDLLVTILIAWYRMLAEHKEL